MNNKLRMGATMSSMERWSDAKLENEHKLALAAQDLSWLASIIDEMERRNAIDDGDLEGEYGPHC